MDTLHYFEPEVPLLLEAPWLQVEHQDKTYAPFLVRIRKRQFSAKMIRGLDLNRHAHSHRIYHLIYYLEGANRILIGDQVLLSFTRNALNQS